MAGPALVSMAQQFSGLPMNSLIGGPLMAAAEANHNMAMTQVQFMMDSCFQEPEKDDGAYEPVMINMTLTRQYVTPANADAPAVTTPIKTTISLPLLTIIPLNSLAVDDVTVDFKMQVKSSFSDEKSKSDAQTTKASGTFKGSAGIGPFSVSISGSVSSSSEHHSSSKQTYQKSNSAEYDVHVHAGQLPLPEGVGVIIKAYSEAINPIIAPASEAKPPEQPPKG